MLFVALAVIAAGAAYAAVEFRWFSSGWALAGFVVVGIAFVGAALGIHHHKEAPRNEGIYGAAKPASEAEAHAAATGAKKAPLHERMFPD